MTISSDSIIKLCATGCNVTIYAGSYSSDSVIQFATCCKKYGGILTIKNSDKFASDTRLRIGTAGGNHVTFDFT